MSALSKAYYDEHFYALLTPRVVDAAKSGTQFRSPLTSLLAKRIKMAQDAAGAEVLVRDALRSPPPRTARRS